LKGFGPWLLRGAKGIKSFFENPKERSINMYVKLRRELDTLTTVQLIAVLVTFTLFLILPLISVVAFSFTDPNTGLPSLFHFQNLFQDTNIWPWYYDPGSQQWYFFGDLRTVIVGSTDVTIQGWDLGAVINSIYVAIITTIFSVLLGVFLAFIVARYDFFGKSIIRTVLIFPILATPFVGAIGIKAFLGLNGLINNLFYDTLHIFPLQLQLKGLAAIIFVQSLSFFSLVYLNAYSSFMSIDPSLEEQAENLGAKGSKLFRSVTLPLAMPGIQAGAILTFILSIEDLGTPIVFQEDTQAAHTLAFQVFDSFASGSLGIDPKGPAIGIILLIFALSGFLAIRKYAGVRSYESGTKGGQWNPRVRRISNRTTVLLYAVLIPLLFLALIPQISVIMLSFAGPWASNSVLPTYWTLEHYSILTTYPAVTQSITFTLVYGAIATVIIVLLGTSAAYIIARRDIPGKTYFDLLVTSPIALPGIVIATGYFVLYYGTPFFPYDAPAFLIIMSYTVRKFPFTVRAAYAGLQSTPVVLEEASQNMGASKNQTFAKITMPLIGVSVLAGSLLSFVYSVSEVSTSLILGSLGPEQAPMTFWTKEVLSSHSSSYSPSNSAATLGVLMMAMQMTVITVTNKILGARSSAMTGI
jgi:ABC-type Fe3+ transport system permease subunit